MHYRSAPEGSDLFEDWLIKIDLKNARHWRTPSFWDPRSTFAILGVMFGFSTAEEFQLHLLLFH